MKCVKTNTGKGTEKMKVYISIPITGHLFRDVKKKAEQVKRTLSEKGHTPVSPLDLHGGKKKTYAQYIGRDIEALVECDAIFLCSGWQESKGCSLEYQAARIYGKIIMNEIKE